MIHYHGTPISSNTVCATALTSKHAFVSFASKSQLPVVMEVCQSFAVDNGAFAAWRSGNPITDWQPYYDWVADIKRHPGFDFAVVPDVIDGTEEDNDALIEEWKHEKHYNAVVWHIHESIDRLKRLASEWPRLCIGSSGQYSTVGTKEWWDRMSEIMNAICDDDGYPMCRLHGMRMLNPKVFSEQPFTSVDSTNVGRNIGIDKQWKGNYTPPDKEWRAKVMIARIESHNGAQRWLNHEAEDEVSLSLLGV